MKSSSKKGFTVLELIVSITILTILSSVAFVSYLSFAANARDGTRRSDIGNIKGQLYERKQRQSIYPLPDSTFAITNSGTEVAVQGWLTDKVHILDTTTIPSDPKGWLSYGFSELSTRLWYELYATLETPSPKAYVDGSFKSSAPKIMPSLFLAQKGTGSLEIHPGIGSGTANSNLFIVDGMEFNLLYDLDGNSVANNTQDLTGILATSSYTIPIDTSYPDCKAIYEAGMSVGAGNYTINTPSGITETGCVMSPPNY